MSQVSSLCVLEQQMQGEGDGLNFTAGILKKFLGNPMEILSKLIEYIVIVLWNCTKWCG